MKKLTALMLAVAFALTGAVHAIEVAPGFVSRDFVLAAGVGTNTTEDIRLYDVPGPLAYRDLDEFIFQNGATGLVTVTLYAVNLNDESAIATLSDLAVGSTTYVRPRRSELSQTIQGWVVTGDVAVATSTVVSNTVPYSVRRVRVKVVQDIHAAPVTHKLQIKAK
jgi:hypothetical protein